MDIGTGTQIQILDEAAWILRSTNVLGKEDMNLTILPPVMGKM